MNNYESVCPETQMSALETYGMDMFGYALNALDNKSDGTGSSGGKKIYKPRPNPKPAPKPKA